MSNYPPPQAVMNAMENGATMAGLQGLDMQFLSVPRSQPMNAMHWQHHDTQAEAIQNAEAIGGYAAQIEGHRIQYLYPPE